MKVFISHRSALEYWRLRRTQHNGPGERKLLASLPGTPPATAQVKRTGLTLPLHVLLSDPIGRWRSQTMKQHVFIGPTPFGCFVAAKDDLMVSSPEFCFLQMASELSLVELIELGFELCGEYSLFVEDDPDVSESGFYNRKALTSTKKLDAFVARMPHVWGQLKARRALRYLLDGSASPMETKLAILLTLPYKLGGYGFIPPKLNSRLMPSKTAKRTSSKGFYSCDLYWPDYGVAVEYDSDLFHTGSTRIADDSKRRNTLALMGVTVITVTKQQLYSSRELEKVTKILAGFLEKRLKYKNPGFSIAHRELRNQLL